MCQDIVAEARNAILLAEARMKQAYDEGRRQANFAVADKLYLKVAKGNDDRYKILDNVTELSFTKLGPL
jgi:hypothetical protein